METTFDTPGQLLVIVENSVGTVRIGAGDATVTEVTIEADSSSAQELVDRALVECRPSAGRDVLRVKIPHRNGPRFMRRNGVTVGISVPLGTDVDISTASADVELRGELGSASVKTASGDVVADQCDGDVQAKTASGGLSMGRVGGSARLYSASGDLRATSVAGYLAAKTASGDIEVGSVDDHVDARCTSGDVRLGYVRGDADIVGVSGDVRVDSYGSGRMQVRSVSGDVLIGIPTGVNLSVDAETMSGTVRSEIPLGDAPITDTGAPVVIINARSVSGDVLIERAAGASLR